MSFAGHGRGEDSVGVLHAEVIERGCPTLCGFVFCKGWGFSLRFVLCKGGAFSSMPRRLKRSTGRGDLHFITFSCYERRPFLQSNRVKNTFVKILEELRGRF